MFGKQRVETGDKLLAFSLSEDGVKGLMDIICKKDPVSGEMKAHPGHVVLAVKRILQVAQEHPMRFAYKPIDSMTLFQMMPEYGIDLGAEALSEWANKQSENPPTN